MAGGYVAGRMRSRWHETGHEVEFRDGLHGGLVWAVGVVIGAALFLSAAGSVAKTGAEVAGGAAAVAGASTQRSHGRGPGYDAAADDRRPSDACVTRSNRGGTPPSAAASPAPRARAVIGR